jgi:hypothetical protein
MPDLFAFGTGGGGGGSYSGTGAGLGWDWGALIMSGRACEECARNDKAVSQI